MSNLCYIIYKTDVIVSLQIYCNFIFTSYDDGGTEDDQDFVLFWVHINSYFEGIYSSKVQGMTLTR